MTIAVGKRCSPMPLNRYRAQQPARAVKFVLKFDDMKSSADVLKALERVETARRDFVLVGQQITRDLQEEFVPIMISQLQQYPRPSPPGNFWRNAHSDKQRRYVMMMISQGHWDGRSDTLKLGWHGLATFTPAQGGTIRVMVENTARNWEGEYYAPYVMGNIGLGESVRSMTRYTAPIQRFHRNTGWNQAYIIVQSAYLEMRDYAQDAYINNAAAILQIAGAR